MEPVKAISAQRRWRSSISCSSQPRKLFVTGLVRNSFRAAFGPIASDIIEVDADGLSTAKIGARTYRRVRRPIYPLDREAEIVTAAASADVLA